MDVPQDASWTVRKVLGLRDIGQPLILYRIWNGLPTFLWFYNWHSLGLLYKRLGEEVFYNAGRSLLARVSSIIFQGHWRWPRARNGIIRSVVAKPMIPSSVTLLLRTMRYGCLVLLVRGSYSIRSEAVRTKYLEKQWTKIVWFKRNALR